MFWTLAILLTAAASALLFYAAWGRPVNATATPSDAPDPAFAHYRRQLAELEADLAGGRLSEADAMAARAELAREVVRLESEQSQRVARAERGSRLIGPVAALGVAVLAFVTYYGLGNPDLPSQPLAGRELVDPASLVIEDAIAAVEAVLAADPDDLRGWQVIAPVYMQTGRYDDAVTARRRIVELAGADPETETDLAEALVMAAGGVPTVESTALLENAAATDPRHVRSRFYLAGEANRVGDWARARQLWAEVLALATGDEPWLDVARDGFATADTALSGNTPAPANAEDQQQMIRDMVARLDERLDMEGGSLADWTQLVRSLLVLGDAEAAQFAYDEARAAYPSAFDRAELDALAAGAGLNIDQDAQ